jgi:hypothetical protein
MGTNDLLVVNRDAISEAEIDDSELRLAPLATGIAALFLTTGFVGISGKIKYPYSDSVFIRLCVDPYQGSG